MGHFSYVCRWTNEEYDEQVTGYGLELAKIFSQDIIEIIDTFTKCTPYDEAKEQYTYIMRLLMDMFTKDIAHMIIDKTLYVRDQMCDVCVTNVAAYTRDSFSIFSNGGGHYWVKYCSACKKEGLFYRKSDKTEDDEYYFNLIK